MARILLITSAALVIFVLGGLILSPIFNQEPALTQKITSARRSVKTAVGIKRELSIESHYPNVPNEVKTVGGKFRLLKEAASRKEIVAWADMHLLDVQEPENCWFVVHHIGTSGPTMRWVYLYVRYPLKAGDSRPWKLVYVGEGVFDAGPREIAGVYIDHTAYSLVFIDRTGRIIKMIPLKSKLAKKACDIR